MRRIGDGLLFITANSYVTQFIELYALIRVMQIRPIKFHKESTTYAANIFGRTEFLQLKHKADFLDALC